MSEEFVLKRGEAKRYDLVLSVSARLKIEVRADPVPVSVKLVATQDMPPSAGSAQRPSAGSRPVFTQPEALKLIRVEALAAGKWTIFMERVPKPGMADNRDATVMTTVSVE